MSTTATATATKKTLRDLVHLYNQQIEEVTEHEEMLQSLRRKKVAPEHEVYRRRDLLRLEQILHELTCEQTRLNGLIMECQEILQNSEQEE